MLKFIPLVTFTFTCANAIALNGSEEITKQKRIDTFLQMLEQTQKKLPIPGLNMAIITPKSSNSTASNDLPYDVFFKSVGVRNASSKEALDKNTVHMIGSTTKLFTAHVLGWLEDRGFVGWNTPVKYYTNVTFFNKTTQDNATLVDLLSHSTGVSDCEELYAKKGNPIDLMKQVESLPPIGEFRNSFSYSNTMFALAGSIATQFHEFKSSDPFQGWHSILQKQIFAPLWMASATSEFDFFMNSTSPVSAFHTWVPSDASEYKYHTELKNINELFYRNTAPAGVISLNIEDYSKWMMYILEMFQKGQSSMANILSKKAHNFIFSAHNNYTQIKEFPELSWSNGLGIRLSEYKGQRIGWHDGLVTGQSTKMCFLPDLGYGLVLFSNSEYCVEGLYACQDMIDLFLFNQDLSQVGNHTITDMKRVLGTLEAKSRDNQKAIQQNSLKPVLPPTLPKTAYVGTFNYSAAKQSLFTTTLVSETPFRLRFAPTDSYESISYSGMSMTLQHFSGDRFVEVIGEDLVPVSGIYNFKFDSDKLTFVNRTALTF